MKPTSFLHSLALGAALVLGSSVVAHAQDVVRLGNLKFAHYGAVSYMKEIAPKYNLKIEEKVFAKGIDIIPGIIAGEIDIAASAMDGTIAGRAAGVPLLVVAGFSKGGTRIVGRPDMDWKNGVADLKGKKVAVPRGGAQEIALRAELDKAKLSSSDQPGKGDVQLLYMGYPECNQALQQKNVDAMCQSEPQSTQAIARGFGKEIVKPYDTPMGEMPRSFAMTEKLYKEKPDVAARVLKCFVEATKTFIDKPDLAQKYVCEQVFKNQLTPEEYKQAMENAAFTYDVTVENVQVTIDYMVKLGVGKLTNAPKAVDFVKLDLLQKAKADLGVK